MSVVADDFLSVSKDILSFDGCGESHYRAAISRSYYAVYHEAHAAADALSLRAGRADFGEHKRLISRYAANGKRLKIIADRLDSLRAYRVDADYKISYSFKLLEVQKHLAACKSVID
jgi:uncharacterized protein (UPF0332 family)